MPKLYVLSGPDLGRTFEVEDGAKLGRGVDCAIHLRDVSVSREHARIVRDEEGWSIVDTNSRNGVSVGGQRVASAVLGDGQEFLVGEILLRFRADPLPHAPTRAPMPADGPANEPANEPADEIVLEEDPAAAIPVARPSAPAGPARVASELERTVLSAPRPGAPVPRGGGILQYKKIPDRPGFFASDLAQQPLWIRFGLGLIAIAMFAAIFLLAFKGTSFLKRQATGGPVGTEAGTDR